MGVLASIMRRCLKLAVIPAHISTTMMIWAMAMACGATFLAETKERRAAFTCCIGRPREVME